MGESRDAYRDLVGRPDEKKPSGRSRRRWEDNIKVDLQGVGCGYMDWIDLRDFRPPPRSTLELHSSRMLCS